MADATSSAISPTVQSTSNYAPATSNGQNAYDLQRQQAQAQADQQKQAQQAALKRRLAAQGISDSGVNIAAANTVDQNVASTEGAALSNIDTQQLQAAQAADTAAQQYGYNTALQGQQITGNLQNTTLQGQNQMNVQTLAGTQQLTNINANMNATDTEASYAQTIASQNQVATGFYQTASVPGTKPTADQQAAMNANPLLAAAWQAGQSGVPYAQWQQQQTNAQNTQKALLAAIPVGQGDTLEMIDSVGQSLSNGQNFTQAAPGTLKIVNGVGMTYELNGQTYDMATNQPIMTSAATSAQSNPPNNSGRGW